MIRGGEGTVTTAPWQLQRYFILMSLRISYFFGITVSCSESSVMPDGTISLLQQGQQGAGSSMMHFSRMGRPGYRSLGFLTRGLAGSLGSPFFAGFLYRSELAPYWASRCDSSCSCMSSLSCSSVMDSCLSSY